MRKLVLFLALSACTTVNQPVAYTAACGGDEMCQRNLNAQTLKYIGEGDAAARLMCQDPTLSPIMGDVCDTLPLLY